MSTTVTNVLSKQAKQVLRDLIGAFTAKPKLATQYSLSENICRSTGLRPNRETGYYDLAKARKRGYEVGDRVDGGIQATAAALLQLTDTPWELLSTLDWPQNFHEKIGRLGGVGVSISELRAFAKETKREEQTLYERLEELYTKRARVMNARIRQWMRTGE